MRLNRRIYWFTALLLLVATLLSGCAGGKLAAKVGDMEIPVSYLENMYNSNAAYASYYGYDLSTAEGVDAFISVLLDESIASDAKVYQAKHAGLTLTDEEKSEAVETGAKAYEELLQSYIDAAIENGSPESDAKAQAMKYLTDSLAASRTTVKKLKQELVTDAENNILVEKHRQALLSEAPLTEEGVLEMYNEELEAQRTAFESSPATFFTYQTYYNYGYTAMPLTVPEGFYYVRQILVEEETLANDLYERIQAGEDFEKLLAEYNTDPGMEQEDYKVGYLVGEGNTEYDATFLAAALTLKNEGEVSEPTKTDFGWHIIKRMADKTPGDIPFEEIREAFTSYATALHEAEYYQSLVNEWVAGDYIVRYPENYSDIGKAALEG